MEYEANMKLMVSDDKAIVLALNIFSLSEVLLKI